MYIWQLCNVGFSSDLYILVFKFLLLIFYVYKNVREMMYLLLRFNSYQYFAYLIVLYQYFKSIYTVYYYNNYYIGFVKKEFFKY